MATHLHRLSTIITSCRDHIPALSTQFLLTADHTTDVKDLCGQQFTLMSKEFDQNFYRNYLGRIVKLSTVGRELESIPALETKMMLCLQNHTGVLSNSAILAIFRNFSSLRMHVVLLKSEMESILWDVLDCYPQRTEVELNSMMSEASTTVLKLYSLLNFIGLHR